ncbi:MAG: CBS domain-containing protein [Minicystis sp.]
MSKPTCYATASSSLWPKSPSAVAPDTTVGDVLQKMVDERIGCVMIVDQGKLLGIFSERDALMKLNVDAAKHFSRPISQFMTQGVVTLEADDRIAYALHKMNVGGYRHVPILFDGKLAGVISIRDILRYLTDAHRRHCVVGVRFVVIADSFRLPPLGGEGWEGGSYTTRDVNGAHQ